MYSTHNECRSAISERFISTVEKNITSLPQNKYTDKLDDLVNIYNNTCNKMKSID